MSATTKSDDDKNLTEAKQALADLTKRLPTRVEAKALTKRSKLPFKALIIRELLLHRTVAVATATVDLFEQRRPIPAAILTRSIVETAAALFSLHERLETFMKDDKKDLHDLNQFLDGRLMGSRNNPDPEMPKAVNVLSLIDRLERAAPGCRFVYDALCEVAHPNWGGTFGAFGRGIGGATWETTELQLGAQEPMERIQGGLRFSRAP